MHEILVSRWKMGKPCIAVCPTQHLEKVVGFDAALPSFDKLLVLQFKAYRRLRGKALNHFPIYPKQHTILQQYPMNCAYYVFPDYRTHTQMNHDRLQEYAGRPYKILDDTWFVEVHSVPKSAKKVSRKQLTTSTRKGRIPSKRWQKLAHELDSCQAGFNIARVDGIYALRDPEERVVEELRVPSGYFSFFYTRIRRTQSSYKPFITR